MSKYIKCPEVWERFSQSGMSIRGMARTTGIGRTSLSLYIKRGVMPIEHAPAILKALGIGEMCLDGMQTVYALQDLPLTIPVNRLTVISKLRALRARLDQIIASLDELQ